MNLIYGNISLSSNAKCNNDTSDDIEEWFNEQPYIYKFNNIHTLVGTLDDKGCIFGYATSDNATIFLLGSFLSPLPNWKNIETTSPLDDPHNTAKYLLERYSIYGKQFLDN